MAKARASLFGHRTRITAIATATTCLVMYVALRLATVAFNRAEIAAAGDVLLPELRQAIEEVRQNPRSPDLGEIHVADPNVTVAVFDAAGEVRAKVGSIPLTPLQGFGKRRFGNVKAIYQGEAISTGTVMVATPWQSRDDVVDAVGRLGLWIWLAATGCIAIVTWFATRAAFTPLTRMAAEAEALGSANLSGRLSLEVRSEYASFVLTLNRFLDRIEEGVKREERFVTDAAHELRTPLTILRGRIETTLSRARQDQEYREALVTILDETERLSRMVELLLQSSASSGSPAQAIDLEAELERIHARWVDRFHRRGVQLEIATEPATVRILPSELDVIVDNLLANALRASPEGSACELGNGAQPGKVRITVRDEGAGIPPENRESVFERLTRMDAGRNRQEGGFGIGLAVCKRLVQSRHGAISIEPSDKGALFVVELPLAG